MEQTSNLLVDQPFDYQLISKEFNKSIHDNVFYMNKDYLLLNCYLIKFTKEIWRYRPELFCADYYELPLLYPVILMINSLNSIFEFKPENLKRQQIIAPKFRTIQNCLRNRIQIN
jgi:hypothetical protein